MSSAPATAHARPAVPPARTATAAPPSTPQVIMRYVSWFGLNPMRMNSQVKYGETRRM